jgi:hypothetical protein
MPLCTPTQHNNKKLIIFQKFKALNCVKEFVEIIFNYLGDQLFLRCMAKEFVTIFQEHVRLGYVY